MEITWYTDDGYAGSSQCPHEVEVPDEELAECVTIKEAKRLIERYVAQDFRESVNWYYDPPENLEDYINKDKEGDDGR